MVQIKSGLWFFSIELTSFHEPLMVVGERKMFKKIEIIC